MQPDAAGARTLAGRSWEIVGSISRVQTRPHRGTYARSRSQVAEGEDVVRNGDPGWRERYYQHKLGIGEDADQKRRALCTHYVRGLCWVMRYYFQGTPSWTWYFPYHYAPLATDLVGLGTSWGSDPKELCRFEPGEPFLPLVQLMAVLPPLSSAAVPKPLAALMTDAASPLADQYPTRLRLDLNGEIAARASLAAMPRLPRSPRRPRPPPTAPPGARLAGQSAAWKAVVLLPFLDAPKLQKAFAERKHTLPPAEQARNVFGPTYLYTPPSDLVAAEMWQLAHDNAALDGYQKARVRCAHSPRRCWHSELGRGPCRRAPRAPRPGASSAPTRPPPRVPPTPRRDARSSRCGRCSSLPRATPALPPSSHPTARRLEARRGTLRARQCRASPPTKCRR